MILKEYSAVAVVTKLVRIWLTDKLHALVSVLSWGSSGPPGSDGEVKRSEPVKFLTQLYRKKDHYSKLFKTVHAVAVLWK